MVDDKVYKLRLIEYDIDYDSIDEVSVEFSDVIRSKDSASDIQDVLDQAQSMATSYDSVKRQAGDGKNSNDRLNTWVNDGLDLTNMKIVGEADNQNITWDANGLLAREYLPIIDAYDDRQLKLINRGLYVTDDGWETARAGIGNFLFWNPKTQKNEEAYGVIADTIVGNIVLSEEVGIYNKNNSITMDGDGFTLTTNADGATPENVFTIQKENKDSSGESSIEKLLYVDNDGNLTINGNIRVSNSYSDVHTINDLGNADRIVESTTVIAEITADINGLRTEFGKTQQTVSEQGIQISSMSSSIQQNAEQIKLEITNRQEAIDGAVNDMSTLIDATAGQLRIEISGAVDEAGNALNIANNAVKDVDVEYGISDSPTVEPTEWSTNSPQWQAGKYIWQRTKTTSGDGTVNYSKAVCIQGAKGQDGIDGTNGTDGLPGKDGTSSYVHIKYAPVAEPTDSQMSETPDKYIGILVDSNVDDSTVADDYEWSKFEGEDGADGLPGANGEDGTSTYVHFAYSTTSDGSGNFSVTPFDGAAYIGVLTDENVDDSENYLDYAWSRMKGDAGADGEAGRGVDEIIEQYAMNTNPNSAPATGWSTAQPEWQSGYYIWTRSEIHWSDGEVTHTDPVLAKAINGANENANWVKSYMYYDSTGLTIGADGDPMELKMATANDSGGAGFKIKYNGNTVANLSTSLSFYANGNTVASMSGSEIIIGRTKGSYYNTHIDSRGLNIRQGTAVIAQYTGSYIDLGMNSDTATVYFANRSLMITGKQSDAAFGTVGYGGMETSGGAYIGFGGGEYNDYQVYPVLYSRQSQTSCSYGSHGSALGSGDNCLLAAMPLYQNSGNGTAADITFYGSNLDLVVAMDIMYAVYSSYTGLRFATKRVYSRSGTFNEMQVILDMGTHGGNGIFYFDSAMVSVSITSSRQGEITFLRNGGTSTSDFAAPDGTNIRIIKVVGYL